MSVITFVLLMVFFAGSIALVAGFVNILIGKIIGRTQKFLPNFLNCLASCGAGIVMFFVAIRVCHYCLFNFTIY